jgi:hypothetical protein
MFLFPFFLPTDFVSIESVCNGLGQIIRYHPSGHGYGSPWTVVVFAECVNRQWKLKAAWGSFSILAHRRIRKALSAAGMPSVQWQRMGRQRQLSVSALKGESNARL